MSRVESAINIGPVLAADLRRAGITTVEELREVGHVGAWRRLRQVAPDRDCTHTCLAIAGAVAGVRWMTLPAAERARIAAEARAELESAR